MPAPEKARLTRRQWFARTAGAGAAFAVGSGLYAWRVEPHWVSVTRRKMPLAGLPPSLVGKRLVQVSDLHVGTVVDNAYLRRVLRSLHELAPDYLAITGDFMTSRGDEQIGSVIDTLGESPIAGTPTVAVLGNHDYSRSFHNRRVADRLCDGLRELGVNVLRNESTELDGLQVAGCDELWAGRCDLYSTFRDIERDRPAICLAHNPDIADLPYWAPFRGWILSGHTHGGQCRLPFIGAPAAPIRNPRYVSGHVRLKGGRDLYVNRGLGYKRRVRFGVRPEVTVFTLQAA